MLSLPSAALLLQVPAEYPLRPSLVSLAEDKPGAEVEGEAAVKEELCALAIEVRKPIQNVAR